MVCQVPSQLLPASTTGQPADFTSANVFFREAGDDQKAAPTLSTCSAGRTQRGAAAGGEIGSRAAPFIPPPKPARPRAMNKIPASMLDPNADAFATARLLSEALPYVQRATGQTDDRGRIQASARRMRERRPRQDALRRLTSSCSSCSGVRTPFISARRRAADRPRAGEARCCASAFEDGLRVTDAASMEIVEMVLAGGINKSIVRAINAAGNQAFQIDGADPDRVTKVKAVGLSGIDANLISATRSPAPSATRIRYRARRRSRLRRRARQGRHFGTGSIGRPGR